MRKTTLTFALVLACTTAYASQIDQALDAMAGTEASFTQRFTPKGFTKSQVESGSVIFGGMPMMRWTYTNPEQKVFVFDGTTSWFYVAADKQVTVATVDDRRREELPFLLIGDSAARNRLFDVKESANTVTLQPKSATSAIRNVRLTFSPQTHLISELEYSDREGNRTVFELSGYQRRSTPADLFHFSAPAGVQVVNAQ